MEKGKKYWESVIETANEELAELYAERDEVTARLEEISARVLEREQVLVGMERLITKQAAPPSAVLVEGIAGLTLAEAIRTILRAVQTHQTARAIRDILDLSGYDLKQHANALASIHGVLKRLYESGEAVRMEAQGKTFYRTARLQMNRATRGQQQSAREVLARELTATKRAASAVEKTIQNLGEEILKR